MPLGALYCLALSLLLVVSAVARADDVTNHVDLVCNAAANLALVRFSISRVGWANALSAQHSA